MLTATKSKHKTGVKYIEREHPKLFINLPKWPSNKWAKVVEYVWCMGMDSEAVTGWLEYMCADMRDQKVVRKEIVKCSKCATSTS